METEPELVELDQDQFFLMLEDWRESNVGLYNKALKAAQTALDRIGQADMLYNKALRGHQLGLKVRFYWSEEAQGFAIGLENKGRMGFHERDNQKSQ